jgi:hypothetical protein
MIIISPLGGMVPPAGRALPCTHQEPFWKKGSWNSKNFMGIFWTGSLRFYSIFATAILSVGPCPLSLVRRELRGFAPRPTKNLFGKKVLGTPKTLWEFIRIEFLTLCVDLTCGNHLRGALPTRVGAKLNLR